MTEHASPPPDGRAARLHVRGISLDVRLGHLREERARAQRVDMEVLVHFARPPRAVETDELADTVCYDVLVQRMREVVADREFRLVEHLAGALFEALRGEIPDGDALELRVRKVAPPVPEIGGGAEFVLSDG